jgi:hypothetical protein
MEFPEVAALLDLGLGLKPGVADLSDIGSERLTAVARIHIH